MEKTHQLLVVDATHLVAGRLSSNVAKLLLDGRYVAVVNAEKTLISGSKKNIIGEQMERFEIKSKINPVYTPHNPKKPDRILYMIIRGMLPRRKPRGQEALKRLKVYIGIPNMYRSVEKKIFEMLRLENLYPSTLPLANWPRD